MVRPHTWKVRGIEKVLQREPLRQVDPPELPSEERSFDGPQNATVRDVPLEEQPRGVCGVAVVCGETGDDHGDFQPALQDDREPNQFSCTVGTGPNLVDVLEGRTCFDGVLGSEVQNGHRLIVLVDTQGVQGSSTDTGCSSHVCTLLRIGVS